jgi:hypothetical protein
MAKYEKLTDWLNHPQRKPNHLVLTFREIEHIIEDHLPESAHKYRAWWGGYLTRAESSQRHAWLDAGWEVESVNLLTEEVTFRKHPAAETP